MLLADTENACMSNNNLMFHMSCCTSMGQVSEGMASFTSFTDQLQQRSPIVGLWLSRIISLRVYPGIAKFLNEKSQPWSYHNKGIPFYFRPAKDTGLTKSLILQSYYIKMM